MDKEYEIWQLPAKLEELAQLVWSCTKSRISQLLIDCRIMFLLIRSNASSTPPSLYAEDLLRFLTDIEVDLFHFDMISS